MEDIIRLSDQEVGEAIVQYIAFLRRRSFFPHTIKTCKGIIVSPEIEVTLKGIVRGSKISETQHNFQEEEA